MKIKIRTTNKKNNKKKGTTKVKIGANSVKMF